jgi:hypothetical protein
VRRNQKIQTYSICFCNRLQIYKNIEIFGSKEAGGGFTKTFAPKSRPERCRRGIFYLCFFKRGVYEEKSFAVLQIIRTFAAPQNMQGVVTS